MLTILTFAALMTTQAHPATEIIGTWRGTSSCVDRVAAPGCNDETLVYEMTAGSTTGVVHQKGYKVVNGQNDLMGEMDFTYSDTDKCWASDFKSPRTTIRWCLSVVNGVMSGSAWQLPGKQQIRKVDAKRN
jgi:hypothetical protein